MAKKIAKEMALLTAILIAGAVLLPAAAILSDFPATLMLERAFPPNHGVELSQLVSRDRVRHGRMLQSSNGVVDFLVEGTFDPFVVGYLYMTLLLTLCDFA